MTLPDASPFPGPDAAAASEGDAASAVDRTDVLIVGAGPAALYLAFQLGLLELDLRLVDVLPHPGGQCMTLYADKPLYDLPGLPRATGRELTDALLRQAAPFLGRDHSRLVLGDEVRTLSPRPDGRFDVGTQAGRRFDCAAVVIAAGVGAFQPRRLRLPALARLEGHQVFHHLDDPRADWAGRKVLIVGDGDAAVEAALALAGPGPRAASQVALMHRRAVLSADAALQERFAQAQAAGQVGFVTGIAEVALGDDGRALDDSGTAPMAALRVLPPEGEAFSVPVERLLVAQGLSPRLGPVSEWGLAMERKLLQVDAAGFGTSQPGIHAIGDVVTYPGKRKLIVCAFHEATLAAWAIAERLRAPERLQLQYTSASRHLQTLLGVASESRADVRGS